MRPTTMAEYILPETPVYFICPEVHKVRTGTILTALIEVDLCGDVTIEYNVKSPKPYNEYGTENIRVESTKLALSRAELLESL